MPFYPFHADCSCKPKWFKLLVLHSPKAVKPFWKEVWTISSREKDLNCENSKQNFTKTNWNLRTEWAKLILNLLPKPYRNYSNTAAAAETGENMTNTGLEIEWKLIFMNDGHRLMGGHRAIKVNTATRYCHAMQPPIPFQLGSFVSIELEQTLPSRWSIREQQIVKLIRPRDREKESLATTTAVQYPNKSIGE